MKSHAWTAFCLALVSASLAARESRGLGCDLSFISKEWSFLYMKATGEGVVFCEDGSAMSVAIEAKGIGATAGKWKITDGRGKFSRVDNIGEILGTYFAVGGDVGLVRAGTTRLLSKGNVSLALAGSGKGVNVGIALSEFTISRAAQSARRTRSRK